MNSFEKDHFIELATTESLVKTSKALETNGISVYICDNGQEAKAKVLELIPKGAEVMSMTSRTLDQVGITEEINSSGNYDSVRNKLMSMNPNTEASQMRKLGAGPDYAIGSVHAVTENGEILIAAATGSNQSAYAYAAGKVIWVVGTQKIVKDGAEGKKRIYEHCLPLENERALEVYGVNSRVSKILKIFSETPERITIIFVKENLGF